VRGKSEETDIRRQAAGDRKIENKTFAPQRTQSYTEGNLDLFAGEAKPETKANPLHHRRAPRWITSLVKAPRDYVGMLSA